MTDIKVKPLVWSHRNDEPQYEVSADCPFGRYSISNKGEYGYGWRKPRVPVYEGFLPTFDEAKTAAEADYEHRILSALATPPASGLREENEPCPVCGCEERGQGGYLSCECPAPAKSDDNAVEVARAIWLYFRGQHETPVEAGAWFDNHKTLGGPAYIIDLVRSASLAEVTRLKKALESWRHEVGAKASRIDTLTAENSRLRDYLTRIACLSQDTDLLWWQVQARAALNPEGK
jgi:hypothetical protein